jgi:hypothetical protein
MPGNQPNRDEDGQALTAEFLAQLTRVGVDMRAASPRMHEIDPARETENDDGTNEVVFTIDVSGIIETLRRLPDAAGTDAFVRAYNARFPDRDPRAS